MILILPAKISAAEGVYEIVVFVTLGVNTPDPFVHQDPKSASWVVAVKIADVLAQID